MRITEATLASTHADARGDRLPIEALHSIVDQVSQTYVPLWGKHDPRVPPAGRVASAELRLLDDGEYAVVGTIEIFEEGDRIAVRGTKELRADVVSDGRAMVTFDKSYREAEDQRLLAALGALFGTAPRESIMRATEPLSILTISASFASLSPSIGLFARIDEDAPAALRSTLHALMRRRREAGIEHLLVFQYTAHSSRRPVLVQVILTEPPDEAVGDFLDQGAPMLRASLPRMLGLNPLLSRAVYAFANGSPRFMFGVAANGVPLPPSALRGV